MHWWSLCVLVFPPFFDDDTNVNSTFMISKHTGGPGLTIFSEISFSGISSVDTPGALFNG